VVQQTAVQRRLVEVHRQLLLARQELAQLEEQLAVFVETADDARIRSLVSETPLANKEWNEARRHADAWSKSRDEQLARVSELEKAQDELAGKLVG
jgi:uncharacterized protein YbcC (UPF0753/DUF2309 family)